LTSTFGLILFNQKDSSELENEGKSMKSIRVFSVFIVLIVATMMLSGCSKTEEEDQNQNQNTNDDNNEVDPGKEDDNEKAEEMKWIEFRNED
jgi:NADH:ubiquinone oxidoreductase subunit 6 (subunit J)